MHPRQIGLDAGKIEVVPVDDDDQIPRGVSEHARARQASGEAQLLKLLSREPLP